MNKSYIIGGVIVVLILSVGAYFQIQNNKKMLEDLNSNQTADNSESVKIEILKEGSGEGAKNGDTISVHYVGMFEDGTKFDSSRDRGEPFSFILGAGKIIRGWDLGVLGMKVGEIRKLTIPPSLGYGANDYGPIPGGSTLIFEIELLQINK